MRFMNNKYEGNIKGHGLKSSCINKIFYKPLN